MNIFLLLPVLFIVYIDAKLPVLRERYSHVFSVYTKVPSLLSKGSDSLAKLAAATSDDSIYGLKILANALKGRVAHH